MINNYAPYFADLCIDLNLHILHGLMKTDLPGAFTHFAPRGASIIDYILVSLSLFPLLLDFLVISSHESDHLPIRLSLAISHAECISINPPILPHPALNGPPVLRRHSTVGLIRNRQSLFTIPWLKQTLPQLPFLPMPLLLIPYPHFLVPFPYLIKPKTATPGLTQNAVWPSPLSDGSSSQSATTLSLLRSINISS